MISSLARFIIEIATYIKSLKIEQLLLVTMINKTENKHQPCAYYGMKKCCGRVIVNVFVDECLLWMDNHPTVLS